MKIDDIFNSLEMDNAKIDISSKEGYKNFHLNNESLFQLPLICLVILVMADGGRKPRISQVGQLVGEIFESVFKGFKGSSRHLGWSAALRVRSVKAISFLETTSLIEIRKKDSRVAATDTGKKLLKSIYKLDNQLSAILHEAKQNNKNIQIENQHELRLQ